MSSAPTFYGIKIGTIYRGALFVGLFSRRGLFDFVLDAGRKDAAICRRTVPHSKSKSRVHNAFHRAAQGMFWHRALRMAPGITFMFLQPPWIRACMSQQGNPGILHLVPVQVLRIVIPV